MEFQTTRIENKDLCSVLLNWVSIIIFFLSTFQLVRLTYSDTMCTPKLLINETFIRVSLLLLSIFIEILINKTKTL